MKYRIIKQKLKKISKNTYYTNFIKSDEFILAKSTITINKNTKQEKKYYGVNAIQLFKSGFMILHSMENAESESKNIDLIDIETIEVEKE